MDIFKLTAYHGTDKSIAENIVHTGFRCKPNKEHWLGEGIYLYIDKSLAEWWTTKPTKKYGTNITKPVIVKCFIEVDQERVLNLCTLEGYKKYIDLFNTFFRDWTYNCRPQHEVSFKQLRCAFFNYVFLRFDIDMIIAPFVLPDQPYLPHYSKEKYGKEMHILYTEIQVCIREGAQSIIKDKSIIKLIGGEIHV